MNRPELIPAFAAALTTAFPAFAIVSDDFGAAARQAMDNALRTAGVVLVIPPILKTVQTGQVGSRPAEKAFLSVHCRINSAIISAPEPYALHSSIIAVILADRLIHAELAEEASHLIEDDIGLLSHSLNFTAKIVL